MFELVELKNGIFLNRFVGGFYWNCCRALFLHNTFL